MNTRYGFLAMTAALLLAATAHGQILGGVMTVTGAEMH